MKERRPRVLVVDDERHIVDFLAMGLKGRGMDVEGVLNTRESYNRTGTSVQEYSNMAWTRAYEEVIDFIAAGTSPDNIASFRPSKAAKRRVAELIEHEKTTGLTPDETSELEHYLQLEHLMRLAKARARRHLSVE
jgi:hypothetical protein